MASKKKQEQLDRLRKEKELYINNNVEKAHQYERDVLGDNIVVGEWIRKAVIRGQKLREKYIFKIEEVKKVFDFFFYINIAIGGELVRFDPLPWQAWCTLLIFGIFRNSNPKKRVIRNFFLFVARKSGKTSLAAIFCLYLLTKEERGAEIYFAANSRDQASQALKYQKDIVDDSPALKARIDSLQYMLRYKGNGTCYSRTLSNEPNKVDGKRVSGFIVDEIHESPTKEMQGVLISGTGACLNPLGFVVTTAGFHPEFPISDDIQLGKDVMDEKTEDDSTFYAFYTLDSEDEIDNPEMWIKSNPALGHILDIEDMMISYKKACLLPSDKRNFIVKNLNVFQQDADTWIKDEDYKTCQKEVPIETFLGKKVYLGVDLSTSKDLTSLNAAIEDDEGKLHTYPFFFFPLHQKDKMIRKGGYNFQKWIDKGYIEAHDAKIVDYHKVMDKIRWFNDNFDVISLCYDDWNFTIMESLINSDTDMLFELICCKQNTSFFNFPMKYVERLIFSEQINLSKNPVLRWNAMNMKIWIDGNANCKPMKNLSLDVIDGMIALFLSVAGFASDRYDAVAALMANLEQNTKTE